MHVNHEIALLEILDDSGNPCPRGKRGRCIVTPFYNTAQPIIRYDLGDQATFGEPCSCGRTMPVISELNGRTVHLFQLPDGRKTSLRLYGPWRQSIGALDWQLAQTAPEQVEVRYLKFREASAGEFATLTEIIRSQMTANTKVTYHPVAALPKTSSGKVLLTVCELPKENS